MCVCVHHVCFDSFRFFFILVQVFYFCASSTVHWKKINGFSMNQLKHIQTIHIMNASYAPMNKELQKKYEISCGEFTNYFFIGARRTLNRVSAWYAHHTEYIWKVSVFVTFDCFVLIFTNYYQLNFHSQTLETKSTTIRLWAAKNGFFSHFACCQWLFFAFNRTEGLIWILFDNQRCNQSKWRRPVTPNSHLAAIRMICKIFDCLDLWWFCWKSITLDSIRILFMFGSSIIAMEKNAPYFFSLLWCHSNWIRDGYNDSCLFVIVRMPAMNGKYKSEETKPEYDKKY